MNRILTVISIILTTVLSVFAQENGDSIILQQLDEVVVKASLRTQKGDTLCITPSASQRKFSATGFELLRNIMLPGLRVNTITGELSLSDGNSAIVLINDRPVDRQDIIAIRPQDVARIEYIQNPGLEYGYNETLGAVINVILKKRNDGYAAAIIANNAITTANGQNFAFGKYTKENSEYGISFNSDYTSLTKRRIDNTSVYFIDNDPYNINYKGLNTPLKYTENTIQAGYNHFIPSKHIFDVTFKGVFYYSPDRSYAQKVFEDNKEPYFQLTEPYEKYLSPRLNIYYKKYLNEKSSLTANIVGNYRHTNYQYSINEFTSDFSDKPSYNYEYGSKSNRQSYIGEIKYINKFNRRFNLSVGSRVSYAFTSNKYIGEKPSIDRLHDTDLYAYASSFGYFGPIYYMAGIGISGRIMSQNGERMTKWLPRPQLQLVYNLKGWKLNLYGTMSQESPSLSEMAATEYSINRFEIKKGNPNLTNWWKYRFAFRIAKNIGPINLQNTLSYINSIHPVMSFISKEQTPNKTLFITSFDNQKRMSILTNSFNLECGLTNNLALSMGLDFKSYQSRGLTYAHNLKNWQFNIAADWFAGNWNAGINWRTKDRSLSGESFSYSGATNTIYVNYIIGNQWRIGIMGQHIFSKNGPTFKENIQSNYLTKSETTIVPAHKNMIMVTVAWNFSSGKQRKEANIDLNNEDNESGIFK